MPMPDLEEPANGLSDKLEPVERDWIAAARNMLIEGGIAAVQINPLAAKLGVTRGGFYWRFRNRQDLLDQLFADWENTNGRAFLMAIERAGTPQERYRRMVRMLIDEKEFNPSLDTAIRQWGYVDAEIRSRVAATDKRRIEALTSLFLDAGQAPEEAMVRARIVYFHQVGYYALGIVEKRQERRRLVDTYNRILTGFDT